MNHLESCEQQIIKTYWTCHWGKHRHRTKQVAEKCIARFERGSAKPFYRLTHDQMREMQSYRDAGETYAKIGARYNRSTSRVGQILDKWARVQRHEALMAAYEKQNQETTLNEHG